MTYFCNMALLAVAIFVLSACGETTSSGTNKKIEMSEQSQSAITQQQAIDAALAGNLPVVKQALAEGRPVNQRDLQYRTLLMYAAYNGQTEVVKTLVDAGADVNAGDKIGSTALMFASSGAYPETVQFLLKSGAKINTVDKNEHFSALMWAAAEGQTDVVKLLLKNGADTSLTDTDGDTAASFAAKAGHVTVVEILKQAEKR